MSPGAVVGILGGGQLGRMLAVPLRQMGYGVGVYAPEGDAPAVALADFAVRAPWDDLDAVRAFAACCDVVTYEFENVPAATAQAVADTRPLHPSVGLLATTQDRIAEHAWLHRLGIPTAPGRPVYGRADLDAAMATLGTPGRLKSARGGYDGGGQWRLRDAQVPAEVAAMVAGGGAWLYERDVAFRAEVSVIVCRSGADTRVFPIFENVHADGILARTTCPAAIDPALAEKATGYARRLAEDVDLRGTLTVECFVTADDVLVNELAPRVHNSGHLTIEAMVTSQFAQHVRAVCGLPLGDPSLLRPAAMANLLGDVRADTVVLGGVAAALAEPGVALHLYGKAAVRPRRKMGHLTATASSVESALSAVSASVGCLTFR